MIFWAIAGAVFAVFGASGIFIAGFVVGHGYGRDTNLSAVESIEDFAK